MSVEIVVHHGRHEARLVRPPKHTRLGRWLASRRTDPVIREANRRAFWDSPLGTVAFVGYMVGVFDIGMLAVCEVMGC